MVSKVYPIVYSESQYNYQWNLLDGIFISLKKEKINSQVRPVFNATNINNLKIYYFDGDALNGTLLKVELLNTHKEGAITIMGYEPRIDKLRSMLESILNQNLNAQFIDNT